MNPRLILLLAALLLVFMPIRAEDYLKEAQQANSPDSPFVKISSDRRVKVTLLYIGPVHDKQIHSPFVVVYLREDCRSDEDYERHHITFSKDGYETGGGEYYLPPSVPEVKDHSRRLLTDGAEERARGYDGASQADFTSLYPNIKIPTVEHPKRVGIFEYFFKSVATGPFDITMHDHFAAYGENNIRFRDIDAESLLSH